MEEYNDIYDEKRIFTGRTHLRGTPWEKGEYCLVVCVWVYDGRGHLLMTRRAPEKSFAGNWENSGGVAQAGETSLQAIVRELREETGIVAAPEEFELFHTDRDRTAFYDFYCLKRDIPLEAVTLQPGETDDVKWVTFAQVHEMIERGEVCKIIANQYLRQEPELLARQNG